MKKLLLTYSLLLTTYCLFAQSPGHLQITHLTGDFYVYTTWQPVDSMPYPSNSMFVVAPSGIIMIDTPWDTTQSQPLWDSLTTRFHKKVLFSISTHCHGDRTNGVNFLRAHGVKTYCSKMTYDMAPQHGNPRPQYYFTKDTTFVVDDYKVETFYPGPGHTADNIVVWFPKDQVLYGGCFLKSEDTQSLGYLKDADVKAWPVSIKKVMARCPNPKYIIPGHQGWSGN